MVTVRNDIEMMATAPDGTKVKDVNLKQDARPARRKSYRCITIVGVVTVVLLSLAVGSVLFFEHFMSKIPTENAGDGSPSSTVGPDQTTTTVPLFADPFDRTSDHPRHVHHPVEADEEIDIDEVPSNPLSTTTEAAPVDDAIDEGSGAQLSGEEDDNEDEDSSGSGAGDDDMW